ncbi:pyridoxamine 5'-phosphate oxidase family protein [Haloferacaceae archaeon DSL9]
MDHLNYTYTVGMTDDEIRERLDAIAAGVLSLADDGDAYGVPVGCHYDGESIYVRLGRHEDSDKLDYVETTRTASFLAFDGEDGESWSVIASGPLRRVELTELAFDPNDAFGPIRVFGEDVEELDPIVVELRIDSLTGRKT